jgi:predicted nucleic acid-binding protein
MTSQAVFADANVLLEATLQGRRSAQAAQDYLGTSGSIIVSPLSAHLMVYFGQKDGLELPFLLGQLAQFKFTDFGAAEIAWAFQNHQDNDFEDALQVACAVLSHAQKMVTFDKQLAQKYRKFINIDAL